MEISAKFRVAGEGGKVGNYLSIHRVFNQTTSKSVRLVNNTTYVHDMFSIDSLIERRPRITLELGVNVAALDKIKGTISRFGKPAWICRVIFKTYSPYPY